MTDQNKSKQAIYNSYLEFLREPNTIKALEEHTGKANMKWIVGYLTRMGYLAVVDKVKGDWKNKQNIYQTAKYPFEISAFPCREKPVYNLRMDDPAMMDKYRKQNQQARREWKSPKVFVGGIGEMI